MAYKTLIPSEFLVNKLNHPNWVIFDCRFDLANPSWGKESYLEEHIPGAVYAHLDNDLSDPVTEISGRHPLPDLRNIGAKLGQLGVTNKRQIVVYDTSGGGFAVRLWWLLRYLGHTKVALLDGGMKTWKSRKLPVSSGMETPSPGKFIIQPNQSMIVNAIDVERIRNNPNYRLIDARAPERFRGEVEPIDTKKGHIPGAVNRFHGLNLRHDGTFQSAEQLQKEFHALIGDIDPRNVIVYCGSGVTSCHHILAMEIAGYSGVKLFPGSWSEWIRDPNHEIAFGE